MSCMDVVSDMVNSIDDVNTEIIINMIAPHVKYEDVCIKPNITFDYYFQSLKKNGKILLISTSISQKNVQTTHKVFSSFMRLLQN